MISRKGSSRRRRTAWRVRPCGACPRRIMSAPARCCQLVPAGIASLLKFASARPHHRPQARSQRGSDNRSSQTLRNRASESTTGSPVSYLKPRLSSVRPALVAQVRSQVGPRQPPSLGPIPARAGRIAAEFRGMLPIGSRYPRARGDRSRRTPCPHGRGSIPRARGGAAARAGCACQAASAAKSFCCR